MSNKNHSIILQTCLKVAGQLAGDANEVLTNTRTLYAGMLQLHEEYSIPIVEYNAPTKSFGRGGGFEQKETKGRLFEVDGARWFDYRQAKIDGTVKPTFPDFKSSDGASIWMESRDGTPSTQAIELARAADLVAPL